uniref:Uncharacterized protein n=1 Tax=Strombidium rassoulzadegani TaxID=1082188 RepID=A0A7S3FTU8_9SPIT|mmetsp:Transcript_15453/g.26144  ORF Transcript_15453/g.26144 Transcript_15453/m.26144 type:complete len:175 (+) Transcript_15453:193-717(+)|eukprot:CAMPEP_0168613974 /NCGR_PEP_ID=MMETSP0449_2-20121227/3731_1 /TAXON_ID=1082188 /ORGANISM="Strombidium rassoulzadegani, Strain ras09" /LENGTH=174 /DNA_ID=CAMNT_0008654631 /DNA_START=186 /DNA_END=710 /DNA_ORIENTATION=+
MWSLEDYENSKEVQDIVQKAIDCPKSYVVKPQKEGGGNNYYDEEAKELLKKFIDPATPLEERESFKQYMIMDRIYPPMIKAWMLRDGKLFDIDSLSELGLYSCLFIDTSVEKPNSDSLIQFNENFGTLMRTKGSHSNEGGVNAGYAVIDQPILYIEKDQVVSQQIKESVSTLKE